MEFTFNQKLFREGKFVHGRYLMLLITFQTSELPQRTKMKEITANVMEVIQSLCNA